MVCMRHPITHILLEALLDFPLAGVCATVTLTKDGPKTAREGDLIEYRLEVVNTGTSGVTGVEVLYTLPAELTFVLGIRTQGVSYFSTSGMWTLAAVGTVVLEMAAFLRLQSQAGCLVEHVRAQRRQCPDSGR